MHEEGQKGSGLIALMPFSIKPPDSWLNVFGDLFYFILKKDEFPTVIGHGGEKNSFRVFLAL